MNITKFKIYRNLRGNDDFLLVPAFWFTPDTHTLWEESKSRIKWVLNLLKHSKFNTNNSPKIINKTRSYVIIDIHVFFNILSVQKVFNRKYPLACFDFIDTPVDVIEIKNTKIPSIGKLRQCSASGFFIF